jgi:predicted nucleic acid-binding protein
MVEAVLAEGNAAACSINLGEVLYIQIRAVGPSAAKEGVAVLRQEMKVICPNWELVVAAAEAKARGGLSYADAFCVATAERLGSPLWTGDPEIIERAEAIPGGIVDLRQAPA